MSFSIQVIYFGGNSGEVYYLFFTKSKMAPITVPIANPIAMLFEIFP